ncbi:MAG: ABC transporter permease [Lachnospiraceae bacterium]|nr:ABC transporter permease [Lachnospiraceae bacterium]
MLILENIALAFTALLSNKMRSLLTMLGIIIGIGSVIAIVTVGNSLSNSISSSMESMGANNIMVGLQQKETEDEETDSGMRFRGPDRYREPTESDYFTKDMLQAYAENFPNEVKTLSLTESLGTGQVTRGTAYANVALIGVNDGYFKGTKVDVLTGSGLSARALANGKAVALVSDYFVNNLFAGDQEAALGQEVEVLIGRDFYTLTITGVYKYEQTMMSFTSAKDTQTNIFVPIGYAQKQDHMVGKYTDFTVVTQTGVDTNSFIAETKRFFDRWYHNNKYMEVGAFSLESMISTMTDMMDKVSIAISVIAGISLLVGGIGVMNIMMVSISERTREIGTRKALGATNGSIRLQFIVEAMVLCLVGGIFGVLLGVGGGALGAKLLGYEASPSVTSILVSLLFSLAIGVFFGFYPANKAARMNPIDALRYE